MDQSATSLIGSSVHADQRLDACQIVYSSDLCELSILEPQCRGSSPHANSLEHNTDDLNDTIRLESAGRNEGLDVLGFPVHENKGGRKPRSSGSGFASEANA